MDYNKYLKALRGFRVCGSLFRWISSALSDNYPDTKWNDDNDMEIVAVIIMIGPIWLASWMTDYV